jgi:hypothetical protein
MRYSTAKSIEIAMAKYLKDPKKATSIMPPQFFLKFPMKEAVVLDKNRLESDIQMFIEKFDIKKKLRLKS